MRTVNALALFILLTFLHVAFSETLSKPKCKKLFPSITIETNNTFYYSFFDKRKRVTIRFGDFLQMTCIGNGKLAMTKDGEDIFTEIKDGSISAIIKPDRKISKFVCTDGETGCQRSVVIYIEQVIKVVSGNIEILNKNRTYTIKYGSPLEVLCSGIGRFVMTRNSQRLPIEQNETIKWFERKPEVQSSEFICTDVDTSFNTSVMIKVTPLMSIRTGNETVKIYQGAKKYHEGDTPLYPVTYGDDFEVFCFGKGTHILAENKEITEYMNETTSKGLIEKFDKIELILNCIGDDDDCVSTIKVVTKPRIYITSPNIRIGKRYIVKYGDRVDIFCSTATTKKLKMAHHYDSTNVDKLTFITVNETTIKYVIDKPEILLKSAYNTFACLRVGKALSRIELEIQPETENFRCVSHNRQYLNCTWNALSHISNLTLSFIQNGISIPICEKNVIVPGLVFYVWHQDQYPVGYKGDIVQLTLVNFVMQSCNYITCFNQSFIVDHLSIVKLKAPWKLKVNSTSTRTVRLRWFSPFTWFKKETFTSSNGGIVHKVEYSYSGIQPVAANTSLISCDWFYCDFELKLPCPGQSYEVWVYRKLAKVGDEFWSDPTSIIFQTDIENDKTRIVDEICTQKPRKTKEVMIYFVQELREHVRHDLEMQQMKHQSLKDKRDKIRAYLDRVIDAKHMHMHNLSA